MSMLGSQSKSSLSPDVDFLSLCTKNVRIIEDLVKGGNLLNQKQCWALSTKLSKTNLSIAELVLRNGAASATGSLSTCSELLVSMSGEGETTRAELREERIVG